MVDFNRNSHEIASLIATRAVEVRAKHGIHMGKMDRMSLLMDLCAADGVNGNAPIDMQRLYEADDFNFSHDVFGIERHMDRETGKIGGFFVPRFAKRATAA